MAWFRHCLIITLEILGSLFAGLLVLALVFSWRVAQGPLTLKTLQPYMLKGLQEAFYPFEISMNFNDLHWTMHGSSLGFVARDVQLKDGAFEVANFPVMDIGFSIPSLIYGKLAPSRIRLEGPTVHFVRTLDNTVQMNLATSDAQTHTTPSSSTPFHDWVSQLVAPPGHGKTLSSLQRFEIKDAHIELSDYTLGVRWRAPRVDILMNRTQSGMGGSVRFETDLITQKPILTGAFLYLQGTNDLKFSINLNSFNPALMEGLSPAFADFGRLNFPIKAQLSGRWALPLGLNQLDFDGNIGEGTLGLQPDQPPLNVKYAQIQGTIDRQNRNITVNNLYADFDGPKVSGAASMTKEGENAVLSASTTIENMPAKELSRYWLPNWAKGARDWVTTNIQAGLVPKAAAEVELSIPLAGAGNIYPRALSGQMALTDLTVNYFKPLPVATQASGTARYDLNGFYITVDDAHVGDLTLSKGSVNLTGLADDSDQADINITVKGSLADQLALLDHPPLRYPSRLGLKSDMIKGDAVTQARFIFPLFKDLPKALVAVAAAAKIDHAEIPHLVMNQDLSNANLSLKLDGAGMQIDGKGKLGPASTSFTWNESFLDDVQPRTTIQFKGKMDETARQAFHVAWPEVLSQSVDVMGTYTHSSDSPALLDANIDFKDGRVFLPWFPWVKKVGDAAAGHVVVSIDHGNVQSIPAFSFKNNEASLVGSATFSDNSRWQKITLTTLSLPNNTLTGSVENKGPQKGLALKFTGAKADVSGIFTEAPQDKTATEQALNKTENTNPTSDLLTPLALEFNVQNVITGPNFSAMNLEGRMERSNRGWTSLNVRGQLGSARTPFTAELLPTPTGRRVFVESQDGGLLLSTFGVMKNIRGGRLLVKGEGQGIGPVTAHLTMHDFTYLDAKTLKKIAQQAKPQGVDALSRADGLDFSRMEADIVYSEDRLRLKDAKLRGDLMGLSIGGDVDLLHKKLDLEGTFVPLYGLNNLVGNIPVVGWLLTGGNGGGIFAVTYTVKGSMSAPETSVNPLSMLTPGVLRELFFIDKE